MHTCRRFMVLQDKTISYYQSLEMGVPTKLKVCTCSPLSKLFLVPLQHAHLRMYIYVSGMTRGRVRLMQQPLQRSASPAIASSSSRHHASITFWRTRYDAHPFPSTILPPLSFAHDNDVIVCRTLLRTSGPSLLQLLRAACRSSTRPGAPPCSPLLLLCL